MISVARPGIGCLGFVVWLSVVGAQSIAQEMPQLRTNQAYVEQLLLSDTLQIDDAASVLSFVLNRLPDEVVVYPTENYYYFNFLHGGVKYSGNLRLDAADRNAGKIHFAYFTTATEWSGKAKSTVKTFTGADGIKVEPVAPLTYRVTFKSRSVLFRLNDLANVRPPAEIMAAGEEYLGPVFDESAFQFYLLYNRKIRNFYYILNKSIEPPDDLRRDETRNRIRIAQRSGFVFYQDHFKDRLILIGVYEGNAVLNNYFDGPFDQLPDNFIKGDSLKEAFIHQNPDRAGTIDRFGNAPDGNSRISISPYHLYLSLDELYGFDECAQEYKTQPEKYYTCFDGLRLGIQ